ncbi:MAG: hypothetical protein AAFV77_00185 [Planctomycetota bacterium]
MARIHHVSTVALALCGIVFLSGCSTATPHARMIAPTFASATPAHSTESWASVMPNPAIGSSGLAIARRDQSLGMPAPGYVQVAGAWRGIERPSIDRYLLITVPRTERTFLFFSGSPSSPYNERRAPRVPRRAHPWHTAW